MKRENKAFIEIKIPKKRRTKIVTPVNFNSLGLTILTFVFHTKPKKENKVRLSQFDKLVNYTDLIVLPFY